ncbi:LCP family protein [Streptomyces flavofungini]|uniref:LCP family protein n=1 Tax=Streptomyces flavofungini TaxID=68200 RepID=UPI0025B1BB21|nr:LCP family protein [Streptomyces flavofungini]WJV45653.1 LCP family protein [Streptomyces flavofungini]
MGRHRCDSRARNRPSQRKHRPLRWVLGSLTVLVLTAAGVGVWIYQDLNGNIHAADIDAKLGSDRPANLSPGSKNILVVGSDSRDGANAKYGRGLETMQSDTLMLVHLPADRKWATVVSFPRDSWVRIPACDKGDGRLSAVHHFKINEAFSIGGSTGDVASAAACTIKTVEANTGLRVDHFASLDFQGFKGMVNALGGIEVCPKEAIHDKKAHLDLEAGCQTIRGEEALGYVRTRYSVGDGSDIGRIGRQQEFMEALAEKAQSKLTNPKALYGFLKSATTSLTTDSSLAGIKPLYGLASELKGVPGDRLTFLTVPNYPRQADVPTDRANVVWQFPQAADLFAALAQDKEVGKADKRKLKAAAKNPVYASSVRVRVLNGTDSPGRAGAAAEQLREAGLVVTETGNAPASAHATRVSYPDGMKERAEQVASRLPGTRAVRDAEATPGVVTVTIGEDFKRVR